MFLIKSAAFSAIIIVGAFVLPPTKVGITDASTNSKFCTPLTLESYPLQPYYRYPFYMFPLDGK